MLECPEAVSEEVPEDDYARRCQQCAIEKQWAILVLAGVGQHRVDDTTEFFWIAEESLTMTLDGSNDQNNNGRVQQPAHDIDK